MGREGGSRLIPIGPTRTAIRSFLEKAGPRTFHIRDFYDAMPNVNQSTVRSALMREVEAGILMKPKDRIGLFQSVASPPLWDERAHYENIRTHAKVGVRGSRSVPLLELLARRFAIQVEEVYDTDNHGYHFTGHFDTLYRLRTVTLSIYPSKQSCFVILGSRDEPLRFWELFAYFVGWLPGLTGIPVTGWTIRALEVNYDHLLAEGVGPLWALSRPMVLTQAVKAMVKIYSKEEEDVARAEVRLSGDIASDVLLDDVKAMLEWGGRLDR